VRIQGAYISDREVEDLVAEVKTFGEPDYIDDEIFIEEESDFDIGLGDADPMFDKALEIVMAAGKASTSYVQRKLKIGYNRAARLVEEMEVRGIVGPANGSKAREIIHVPSKARE
jgi:S-DNA-T family DNA segregation ATPase FtsK/SpoIIIE